MKSNRFFNISAAFDFKNIYYNRPIAII